MLSRPEKAVIGHRIISSGGPHKSMHIIPTLPGQSLLLRGGVLGSLVGLEPNEQMFFSAVMLHLG